MDREQSEASRRVHGYPEDRFDRIERGGRVGAHRVTPKPRHFWQFFVAGLLGFALLTTLGVLWVQRVGSIPELPITQQEEQPKPPEVQPELDPEATVVVLDGSGSAQDLASAVDLAITTEGWGVMLFSGPASPLTESYVLYRSPDDEAAAAGLAEKLGGLPIMETEEFAEYEARLIVVIGADYTGPGFTAETEAPVEEAPVEEVPAE